MSFLIQRVLAALLVGAIVWLELKHPLPQFRLATFILTFLLLANLTIMAAGRTRNALIVLASLAFADRPSAPVPSP
jgi:hypothetical protein